MIQFLVAQDPSTLLISNNDGKLPIHLPVGARPSLQLIKFLIEDSCPDSVRARDGNGNLPIHITCDLIPLESSL